MAVNITTCVELTLFEMNSTSEEQNACSNIIDWKIQSIESSGALELYDSSNDALPTTDVVLQIERDGGGSVSLFRARVVAGVNK